MRIVTGHAGGDARIFVTRDLRHVGWFVAFKTALGLGLLGEALESRGVRNMAFEAFAIAHGAVFEGLLQTEIVMAFKTGSRGVFSHQALEIGYMGAVTGQAFAVLDRLMFHRGVRNRIVVTIQADCRADAREQKLVRRVVRVMARAAFAVFNRLMFYFGCRQKIVVAGETNGRHRPLHFLGKFGFVTLRALVVEVRKVDNLFYERGSSRSGGRNCRVGRDRFSIGDQIGFPGPGRGHAVKEYGKPFLLRCRAASGENQSTRHQGKKGKRPPCPATFLGFESVHDVFSTVLGSLALSVCAIDLSLLLAKGEDAHLPIADLVRQKDDVFSLESGRDILPEIF